MDVKLKQSFPPIADENSRILILGTMPGERSLKLNEYYAHKRNQFWQLVFNLFQRPLTDDYAAKRNLLLEKGVALWDVLLHCEGKGAADSAIKNEVPNDFSSFYAKHPGIKQVFFSSGKAQAFYRKYITGFSDLSYDKLPSPSPMNTWKTFEEKLAEWQKILTYL